MTNRTAYAAVAAQPFTYFFHWTNFDIGRRRAQSSTPVDGKKPTRIKMITQKKGEGKLLLTHRRHHQLLLCRPLPQIRTNKYEEFYYFYEGT